jgi:5-formyltetrahydrofolate cyclo-ligase
MNLEEKIKRINELYHKSQETGLSDEEKEEQKRLRQEYVASVRNNLKSQLDNINIQEADGSITNLGQKYGKESSDK